jgi:hypothetical protein
VFPAFVEGIRAAAKAAEIADTSEPAGPVAAPDGTAPPPGQGEPNASYPDSQGQGTSVPPELQLQPTLP